MTRVQRRAATRKRPTRTNGGLDLDYVRRVPRKVLEMAALGVLPEDEQKARDRLVSMLSDPAADSVYLDALRCHAEPIGHGDYSDTRASLLGMLLLVEAWQALREKAGIA